MDANTSRVIGRVYSVSYKGDLRRNDELKEKAEMMLPDNEIKKFNWALLDIGALLCERDFPRCPKCPLNQVCNFYEEKNVLIVPIQDYAFSKVIEENIYAFPSSQGKRVPEYIAFYQTRPVSSVTHLGKVGGVEKGIEKGKKLSMKYRVILFGDKVNEEATVVNIKKLKEFDLPIPYDGKTGIRGPIYTSLKNIDEANNIKEL